MTDVITFDRLADLPPVRGYCPGVSAEQAEQECREFLRLYPEYTAGRLFFVKASGLFYYEVLKEELRK